MKLILALLFLGLAVIGQGKRPPWYKPCWIYLCGMDSTDPVCAWDPRHGARLFRNPCEMSRHNFCYDRNYGIIDKQNDVAEDIKLCDRLKTVLERSDGKQSVVKDDNVRVHFVEDPEQLHAERRVKDNIPLEDYTSGVIDLSKETSPWDLNQRSVDTKRPRLRDRYLMERYRNRVKDLPQDSSYESESAHRWS